MGEYDPYSTACIEPRRISRDTTKIPEIPKKSKFFSKAGKTRLRKIWDDKRLDTEILFTGITEPTSDAYVREKVSDYVQHYLFMRARRLSLSRRTISTSDLIKRYDYLRGTNKYKEYEDFLKAKHLHHDELRMANEVERITRLLISGRIKYAPEGFHEVLCDPILKVNRLMDSVKKLERSEIKVKVIPLEIRTTRIKNVGQVLDSAKVCQVVEDPFNLPRSSTALSSRVNHWTTIKENLAFVCESTAFSTSSGFNELTTKSALSEIEPDPASTLGSPGMLQSSGYFVELPASDRERVRSTSVFSDLSDQEIPSCTEKQLVIDDVTGDLEISSEFSWKHASLILAKDQPNCNMMYKLASGIVQMFQRQEVAGDEFMEYLSRNYFK